MVLCRQRIGGAYDPSCKEKIIVVGEWASLHSSGRFDEIAVGVIYSHMVDASGLRVAEKHQIAFPERIGTDCDAAHGLLRGVARQDDADLVVGHFGQARTVHAFRR